MRTAMIRILLGACATVVACSDAEQGPNPFSPSLSAPAAAELRIVSPADGSLLTSPALTVLAEQQVRGGPSQGRAQLQSSPDGVSWARLGAEIAWSAQDSWVAVGPIGMSGPGVAHLRLVVYEVDPSDPFLVSNVSTVRCLGQSEQQIVELTR